MIESYRTANEHTRDELALVALFIARALARGRTEGWVDDNGLASPVPDEQLVQRFRDIEERLARVPVLFPMDSLRKRLALSLTEQRILWSLIGYELEPRVRRLLRHVATEHNDHLTIGTLVAVFYDEVPGAGYAELSEHTPLLAYRLIEVEPRGGSVSQRRIRVIDRVLEFASGLVRLDPELDRYARLEQQVASPALVMEPRALQGLVTAVSSTLQRGISPILALVGPRGAGRRTAISIAAARIGRAILWIETRELPQEFEELARVLRSIFRESCLFDAAVVFVEADRRDSESSVSLSRALDHAGVTNLSQPVLATVESEWSSSSRRGTSLLHMPSLREAERFELWRRELALASEGLVRDVAARYQVTGGVIVSAAQRAYQRSSEIGKPLDSDAVHEAVRTQIESGLGTLGTRVMTTQRWADVVLPDDTLDEVKEMIARVKHRRRVYEEWGFAKKLGRGLGISALFYGAPGTGKTMVAGLIARDLGLDLYQVDLSKIVSKWVGETEKNLSSLFAAAEAGHAVLLFDEADSLFSKRTDVKSSNDRYANLEVNYLLQRMEGFAGITVLTTNHDSAIDEAFRRRLSFRVEFPVPEEEERAKIWRAVIPAEVQLANDVDFNSLASAFEMSGGYIRNAALRAAFFAAASDGYMRDAHLRRAATLEMAAMGKVIGAR